MKVVAYQSASTLTEPNYLLDTEMDKPQVSGYDILVAVEAVSINPVDTKVRARAIPAAGQWGVLGWDAAGTVAAIGDQVTAYKVGDKVWYAGDVTRSGSNAEFHAVDSRIVGKMPENLSYAEAAALPLTSLTAWEMVFERLNINEKTDHSQDYILIIGASGGVGSIMIQLLKARTNINVIASASRPETQAWVKELGADYVVNHQHPLDEEVAALGIKNINYVVSLNQTDRHLAAIANLIEPQGKFGLIDDPEQLDIAVFKRKSVSIHWEFMFTKSMFLTADIETQQGILNSVSKLIETGKVMSTLNENYGRINAENMTKAHALVASNKAKGKVVLAGF
ncbi:zinc-binding alcohol dehydrogenase family protein [Marinomonas sp. 15G1-11]|uniref:Zinc-type alcohol dehydrogenase-like protein n=1 Tax=Marinomonas phaeophyticola TaxID=3004091 RepID=A0ABT4JWJ3_9GAMM|nr:zinc-binding alcohol dehydrogenase family protein [Marinomonas sp. 15G1-11]MCZ2722742.1 zinc-binding alcohol dehydrogenase family protein [Marinomonas sp. 15G1-11]